MAGQDIRLTISAKDDASKTIKAVAKGLDQVGDAAEDAADSIIKELNAGLDKTETRIKSVDKAAGALASALGPELAGRTDTVQLVQDFEALGVSLDQVEAKAEEFAATIRRADEINLGTVRGELDQVDASMSRVAETTDRSRSVMANFAGNAAQELPGISSALGPLNVAVGQFAEYAAEGGIKLKGLISTFGPIAAGAVAVKGLADASERAAKIRAFRAEEVDAWVESLRAGENAADGLVERLTEAGKVTLTWSQFNLKVDDATQMLNRLGLSAKQYAQLVTGGEPKIRAWQKAMIDAGLGGEDLLVVTQGLIDATADYEKGVKAASAASSFFQDDQAALNEKTRIEAEERQKANDELAEADRVFRIAAAAAGDLAEAEGRARDALRDYNREWDELTDEIDQNDAIIGLIEGFDAIAKAHQETADAGKKSAEEQKAAFLREGSTINETKRKVIEYGKEILGLPAEQVTQLVAMIDEGSYEDVLRRIQILTRNRNINLDIIARGGAGYGVGARAHGGPVSAGQTYVVGEQGPELLQMGSQSGYVHPNGSMGGGMGGGAPITINVSAGISSPRETARAIAEVLEKYGYR